MIPVRYDAFGVVVWRIPHRAQRHLNRDHPRVGAGFVERAVAELYAWLGHAGQRLALDLVGFDSDGHPVRADRVIVAPGERERAYAVGYADVGHVHVPYVDAPRKVQYERVVVPHVLRVTYGKVRLLRIRGGGQCGQRQGGARHGNKEEWNFPYVVQGTTVTCGMYTGVYRSPYTMVPGLVWGAMSVTPFGCLAPSPHHPHGRRQHHKRSYRGAPARCPTPYGGRRAGEQFRQTLLC